MNFITANKRRSSCDNLLSLLQRPLSPFEEPVRSSRLYFCSQKSIFDVPFEDASMEPSPIASTSSSKTTPNQKRVPQIQNFSLFTTKCHDFIAPSFKVRKEQDSEDSGLSQDLFDILEPVMELVRPKRSLEDILANEEEVHYGKSSLTKRQRTETSAKHLPYSEELTVRFRPYQEEQWQAQLQTLIKYKLKHGHCCVPHSHPEDPMLARWVKRQRYQFKKFKDGNPTSTMTERRIQELESIGFVWHSHAAAWFEKLNELKAFKQRNGHCNVPSHYPENAALSTWVKCQRRQYKLFVVGKSSGMTMERFQELVINLGQVSASPVQALCIW